ncbi:MAG TPA: hypothetical protein VGJ77_04855 [Gaiellaceae bacterium]
MTEAALVATLALATTALALSRPAAMTLLTALFAVRVTGQVAVLVARPRWLPPMAQWNFVPYAILLPVQVALLVAMVTLVGASSQPAFAPVAVVYAGVMVVRYALRMWLRPNARWFGGAIPIVFHVVLAAFLYVLASDPR